jgi:hypothetical protein
MNGCYNKYGAQQCNNYENDRIIMNLEQPQSMVNYTSIGFKKIKAPTELFSMLKAHFDRNQDKMKEGKHEKRIVMLDGDSDIIAQILYCHSFREMAQRQHLCQPLGIADVYDLSGRS